MLNIIRTNCKLFFWHLLLSLIILFLSHSAVLAQVEGSKSQGYLCTVLDMNGFLVKGVQVYEDAANGTLKEDLLQNREKRYYYIPALYIDRSSIDIKDKNSKISYVYFEIKPEEAPIADIKNFIKYNGNPDILEGNIIPLCSFGYQLFLGDDLIKQAKTSLGNSLSQTILVRKEIPKTVGDELKESLQNGEALELKFFVDTKLSSYVTIDQVISRIKKSDAYRDLVSPVIGKNISVDQMLNIKDKLEIEMTQTISVDKSAGLSYEQVLAMLTQVLFKETNALFEFDNAKNFFIDIGSARFSSDEVYSIAYSAKNEGDDEWSSNYEKLRDAFNKNSSSTNVKGDTHGSIVGFISGGVNATVDKKHAAEDKLKQALKDAKTAKHYFSNAFDYKWNGKEFIPKGIYDHEVVDLSESVDFNDFYKYISKDQETRSVSVLVNPE